jgi:hypothetical protein
MLSIILLSKIAVMIIENASFEIPEFVDKV